MAKRFAAIAHKDRTELLREKRLRLSVLLVLLLSMAAVAAAYVRVADSARDRRAATAAEYESWIGQGARDPHAAAHFAQWTFRPVEGAALLDPGASPYAGSAIWLEAHARNPAAFRPVEDRTTTIDLGEFSPAWVLQTLGPLLAFLLAAGLVARERERGTLRLLLVSGAHPDRVVGAKARGLLGTMLAIATPVLVVGAAAVALSPSGLTADIALRIMAWAAVHIVWLAIAVLVGVAISARARSVGAALLSMIALWVVVVPLAPRAVASIAETLHPTPSGARFWAEAQAEIRDGFDGSGTQTERTAALESALLREHGVARTEDLPISFRGASLDSNERFGNRVFERRFAMLDDIHADQRAIMRVGALVSPLMALQNLSSAFAGTDNYHLRVFDAQAEAERQRVVNALNRDLTVNGAGNASYKASADLWRSFEPFAATPLPISAAFRSIWLDLVILAGWLAGAIVLLRASAGRLAREMRQ